MKQVSQIVLVPVFIIIGFAIGSTLPSNSKVSDLIISVLRFSRFLK